MKTGTKVAVIAIVGLGSAAALYFVLNKLVPTTTPTKTDAEKLIESLPTFQHGMVTPGLKPTLDDLNNINLLTLK